MSETGGEARPAAARWSMLRVVVLMLAGAQALVFLALETIALGSIGSSESLTRSIAEALAMLGAVPFVLGTLPALVLAMLGRWLWVGLALALLAVAAAAVIFVMM